MTKRKKENKLVADWITREDILSSYFVPEEREKVIKETRKKTLKEADEKIHQALIQNALGLYKDGVDLKIILTSLTEKEFNDILKNMIEINLNFIYMEFFYLKNV